MNQQVVDRIFLAMLGLLLSACAPAFVRTSSLVGAAVVAGSTAIVFSSAYKRSARGCGTCWRSAGGRASV